MYIYWSDKFSSFGRRPVKSDDVVCTLADRQEV